jgi:hypothetical protein
MGLQDELKELQRRAGSYDMLKEEYDLMKDKVGEAMEILSSIGGKKYAASTPSKPIVDKLYTRMKTEDNFQVTSDTIAKALEEDGQSGDNKKRYYILKRIAKLPGVSKTMDGAKLRLFYTRGVGEKPKFEKTSIMGGLNPR